MYSLHLTCYKWMQYTDKNTIYIQNNEKLENHDFFTNSKYPFLNVVKIRDFSEFYNSWDSHSRSVSETSERRRHNVDQCIPPPGNCSRPYYVLDVRPLAVKSFATIPTRMRSVCGKFYWNCFPQVQKYRVTWNSSNGRTDDRPT